MREDTQCVTSGLRSASRSTSGGYIGSAPELRSACGGAQLGRPAPRIEIAMLPDDVRVVLQLDGLAERERHRRQA